MSEKILIVDDQAVMLRLIGIPLEAQGYQIVTAKTGVEALTKIQSEDPDLVILDVMLPDLSGIEICQQIRDRLNLFDLPVIMLSGQSDVEDKVKGLEAGADDYVTKPVDPKEMVARVRVLLSKSERLRQAPTPRTSKEGKTISFIGAKGGVGTSTVVANTALALAMKNHSVIVLELRPYFGTLARQFGLKPTASLTNALEMTPGNINEQKISSLLQSGPKGLRILVGPQKLKEYREIQAEHVDALLNACTQLADYTVVDLPHMPSIANRATVRSSQGVCIVLEPEPSSITSGQALVELFKAWGVAASKTRAVVVNRTQSSQSISASDVERALGCQGLGVVTAAGEMSVRANAIGQPLLLSSPETLVSNTLIDVAHGLTKVVANGHA